MHAIIGGLTGHEAHLAELVSAKAWVPVITPWAIDLTIDYANVPWVFRIAPDDETQARALLEYARRHGIDRIVVATEGTRDGRAAHDRIDEAAANLRMPFALAVEYDPAHPDSSARRVLAARPAALLLWGRSDTALLFLRALRSGGFTGLTLGPSLLAAPEVVATEGTGELVAAAPFDFTTETRERHRFRESWRRRYGTEPRPAAYLAYDAARMVIDAVRNGGTSAAAIRESIAGSAHPGIAGEIRLNSLGGAEREPVLLRVRAGRWVRAD